MAEWELLWVERVNGKLSLHYLQEDGYLRIMQDALWAPDIWTIWRSGMCFGM